MTVVTQTRDADTIAANDPLLSYSVSSTPSPLKASPENPQAPEEIGEVIISVARQSGTPADVEWIRVQVPAGTMAPDLATDLNKISPRISLTGWTVRLDAAAKEFVCAPTGSHAPIGPDTGFTIQLSDIPVSRKVGTAPITVTERSREGNAAFQDRTTVFNLGKFPADFYLRNFLCEPSIIANGGDVKLTWERSANATYELLYPGVDRDVTNRTSLDIEGIKSDTTFYLRATTGDPTNPVVRILTTQVTVLRPDVEVGSLTVHGDTVLNGLLAANGSVDLSQGKEVKLFSDLHVEGTGNLRPGSPWNYEFPCDGIFTVSHTLTSHRLLRPTGSGGWSLVVNANDNLPYPVRKGWRLEITASSSGHASMLFYPFGARS
ncbi:hypothetical protein [Streptomyces beigongshangae]|uniref:hypothetical protein n=1 Tax=Streptomyces beigongshangae TaxID=2841597 RepID=UPI001C84C5F4|nr:hypothetical protein [Streptomyces sp. REN17]